MEIEGKVQRWPHSRYDHLAERGPVKQPDLGAFEYLRAALFDAGLVSYAPSGAEIPLAWEAISAYSWATSRLAEQWERKAVREASQAFLKGKRDGLSPLAMSPLEVAEKDGQAWWTLQT